MCIGTRTFADSEVLSIIITMMKLFAIRIYKFFLYTTKIMCKLNQVFYALNVVM